jgi:ABC-type nitrate/sulfonate/bicarbonate transport system substrate-binding protein
MKGRGYLVTAILPLVLALVVSLNLWAAEERLIVGWSAIAGSQAPLWITKERALFEKNGLDVTMIYIDGGSEAAQA